MKNVFNNALSALCLKALLGRSFFNGLVQNSTCCGALKKDIKTIDRLRNKFYNLCEHEMINPNNKR